MIFKKDNLRKKGKCVLRKQVMYRCKTKKNVIKKTFLIYLTFILII